MNTNNCLNCKNYRTTQTYDYCEATQQMVASVSSCESYSSSGKAKPFVADFANIESKVLAWLRESSNTPMIPGV